VVPTVEDNFEVDMFVSNIIEYPPRNMWIIFLHRPWNFVHSLTYNYNIVSCGICFFIVTDKIFKVDICCRLFNFIDSISSCVVRCLGLVKTVDGNVDLFLEVKLPFLAKKEFAATFQFNGFLIRSFIFSKKPHSEVAEFRV